MSGDVLSFEAAAAVVAERLRHLVEGRPAAERVELGRAAGRVLAEVLRADQDQPPFTRSTRDGFACRADEANAHRHLRLTGASRAGDAPGGPLAAGCAWEIMTGAPVPADADAVAMLEHVEAGEGRVRLRPPKTLERGENVVERGAQARAGDELLAAGTAIGFQQIANAASCGLAEVEVFRRPRVAILTTGDELVGVEAVPAPGQIRNSNGAMLAAMVEAAGGEAWVLPTAADEAGALDRALERAVEADMLLISGGVSAGKFDLVEPALERAGARFHFRGVHMRPGKPTVFAELPRRGDGGGRALPVFGLPGNPVSTAVTFLLFGGPVVAALGGRREVGPRFALARLSAAAEKHGKAGLTRFLPARCTFGGLGGRLPEVELVEWQGSGDLAALARSNCFLVVPEEAQRMEAGAEARILLG